VRESSAIEIKNILANNANIEIDSSGYAGNQELGILLEGELNRIRFAQEIKIVTRYVT